MARKNNISIIKKIRSSESAISMVLGILVVVVVGVLLFKYFRSVTIKNKLSQEEQISEPSEATQDEKKEGITTSLPAKYIIQKGDSLWQISNKFYGYGFNWVDISRENKIRDPDQIGTGRELLIPNVTVRKPITTKNKPIVQSVSGKEELPTISGNTYKVVKGDSLWKISVRAYQDGYKWPEIAKANNLSNPSLIHPGNVLTIPH